MPSKRKKAAGLEAGSGRSTEPKDGSVVAESATIDQIARRAYEIYLQRGPGPGRDLDDWLQAEQELKKHAS